MSARELLFIGGPYDGQMKRLADVRPVRAYESEHERVSTQLAHRPQTEAVNKAFNTMIYDPEHSGSTTKGTTSFS